MSRRANPTIVGGFILGAIALAVVAVIVFGSGSLFRYRPHAVAFFQGNVQGLTAGAPVNLQGVHIGKVTAVRLELDVDNMVARVPVYMEFDPELVSMTQSRLPPEEVRQQTVLKEAIAKGLHARLAPQSLVTGQLLVDLSFYPGEPRTLTGADPSTVEIPTTPSELERAKDVLAKLPIDKIGNKLLDTLGSLDRLVSSPEIPALLTSLVQSSNSINALTSSTQADLGPLADNVNETLRTARDALASAQATLKSADRVTSTDAHAALVAATDAMRSAEKTITNANAAMMRSSTRADLDQTLHDLAATSRALRGFAEQLERKPNSVVLGK